MVKCQLRGRKDERRVEEEDRGYFLIFQMAGKSRELALKYAVRQRRYIQRSSCLIEFRFSGPHLTGTFESSNLAEV
ncbi:hypothetical protein EYF80_023508 [Liparis tanakae]|uniref:Uncharacterized protein n=1 Tax=Liparis tanakae TaxID=230148 RepID=A0A4Z2HMU7_9TELE|nr:hypothetical protein EYF80_023508 [Liparis tanakae]